MTELISINGEGERLLTDDAVECPRRFFSYFRSNFSGDLFKDVVRLKLSDARVKTFITRYPWYTHNDCALPLHTFDSLAEVMHRFNAIAEIARNETENAYRFPDCWLLQNPLIKVKRAPRLVELKALLDCDREYGMVWDEKNWFVIIGQEWSVPFNGKLFSENGIFIHNHPLRVEEGLSDHRPYPSCFDLIQEKGRHFLISRLGVMQYKVFKEDEEDAFCADGVSDNKPRFLGLKLEKEALRQRGIILQTIRWRDCNENLFSQLTF